MSLRDRMRLYKLQPPELPSMLIELSDLDAETAGHITDIATMLAEEELHGPWDLFRLRMHFGCTDYEWERHWVGDGLADLTVRMINERRAA